MAIWNFRYYLIPSTAIKDTFATDKDILFNEYRSNNFPNYNAYREFKNYFINNEVLSSITNEAKKTLCQKSFGIKIRLCSVITMEIVSLFGQMI